MKLYRNLIIILVVIAILGTAMYFVTHYTPEKQGEENTPITSQEELISIYKTDYDNILELEVKTPNEHYTVSKKGENWFLNGDDSIKVKQGSIVSLVNLASSVTAKKIISETSQNADDFGLLNPESCLKIFLKDGKTDEIKIGDATLDGADYYISVSGDEKIYLKNAYGTESLIPSAQSLRDLTLISVDTEDLSIIREVYLYSQGNTPVRLKSTKSGTAEKPSYQWKMHEPVYASMNTVIFINQIIPNFEEFTAAAVIEDYAKNLNLYGLNAPSAHLTIITDTASYKLRFGNETNSYRYCMFEGKNTVYAVEKAKLDFLDISYLDLMSKLIHVENITDVQKIEITDDKKQFELEIRRENKNETYLINGVTIKKDAFSKAYQAVIGISLESVDLSKEPNIEPAASIKYTKTDGSVVTVKFLEIDERNYRVTVNGKGGSITSRKHFTQMVEKLEETILSAK